MYLLLANATQVNSDFRARWLAGSEEISKDYPLLSSRWDKVTCQESRVYFFGICVVYSKTMIHLNVVVSESNLLLDSNMYWTIIWKSRIASSNADDTFVFWVWPSFATLRNIL